MSLKADCSHCGFSFEVARSLKGGLTNCPDCNKSVPVPGGPEALFWVLVGLGALATLGSSVALAVALGMAAGVTAGGIGGVILLVLVLAS